MEDTKKIPEWIRSAHFSPAFNQFGEVIGVEIRILALHNDLVNLPEPFMEAAHSTLDEVAKRNANRLKGNES